MPLARISMIKGKSPDYLAALSENLHQALVECFEVPPDDRFQIIHQHELGELIFDRNYQGGPRSNNFVLINITAGKPRSTATKQAFYRCLVERLNVSPGIRLEDVMVVINTTQPDEWSFGSGMTLVPQARSENASLVS